MTDSRRVRGRLTEKLALKWYQANGWLNAELVPSALPGRDITGMPGLAPEIKARKGFSPLEWMRQAVKNANGDVPFVLMRPNGLGEKQLPDWLVILRNEDFTELLREAGYGS